MTTQPFSASESASSFVANGFERDSSGIGIYFGPDAEVLLDDAFTSGYCFRLADRDANRPMQAGIQFAPTKRKRGRVDIDGAVWIDTTSRSLVDVSWRYTNLNYQIARYEPGGHVWFRGMPNGSVLIDRWFIRIPHAVATTRESAPRSARYTPSVEVHERGGELGQARWPDGQEWHASLGVLSGEAVSPGPRRVGHRIQLLDTPYEGLTDSTGHFTIRDLIPGPYRVGFFDSTLAVVGMALSTGVQFAAARGSTVTVSLAAPTIEDYAVTLCGDDVVLSGDPVVVIRVRERTGQPIDGARVIVRADDGDGVVREIARGASDQRGLVHLCGAPRRTALFVTAMRDGYRTGAGSAQTDAALTSIDVRLESKRP